MRATVLSALLLSGCWKTDVAVLSEDTVPFNAEVGTPEGWSVSRFDMELLCPDGEPARFYLVYPDAAVPPPGEAPTVAMPLALVFHSGAFDFVFAPEAGDPISGTSYQERLDGSRRLTSDWSFTRLFTTLGQYPNYDAVELHVGALPAALAEKGIAMLLPSNCWGDTWHNRSSLADNNWEADLFARDGRTAAEFAFLHATSEFPPSNPVKLPIAIDLDQIFLVGLGEGSRAVTELLTVRITEEGRTLYPYRDIAGAVLDSPIDDLSVFWDDDSEAFQTIRSGLTRLFPGGVGTVADGSLAALPPASFPDRLGLLYSANDTRIPTGALDAALARMAAESGADLWVHESIQPQHVLSNADVVLAKAVADFLAEGVSALDPGLVDGP